ncbi:MAG TPA: hypothetical protein VF173_34625 [Thermoanaerobaculia bacterium]|nr:hypothetical protein [Thermoanaerobaculia bacterium]
MGWDSKLSYPPDANRTVTLKATGRQKARWEQAAKLRGLATAGAFLAWAGDVHLALQRAFEDTSHEHYEALHPVGPAEEAQRREKWARERWEREGGR